MGKNKIRGSASDQARKKLVRAQAVLQQAQKQRVQVVLQNERDLNRAQRRASKRLAKATRRVERRSSDVAAAQQILAATESNHDHAAERGS